VYNSDSTDGLDDITVLFRNEHFERFIPLSSMQDVDKHARSLRSLLVAYHAFVTRRAGTLSRLHFTVLSSDGSLSYPAT
jgi:hypothetical protein